MSQLVRHSKTNRDTSNFFPHGQDKHLRYVYLSIGRQGGGVENVENYQISCSLGHEGGGGTERKITPFRVKEKGGIGRGKDKEAGSEGGEVERGGEKRK